MSILTKKWLVALLSVLMAMFFVFGVSACKNNNEDSGSSSTPNSSSVQSSSNTSDSESSSESAGNSGSTDSTGSTDSSDSGNPEQNYPVLELNVPYTFEPSGFEPNYFKIGESVTEPTNFLVRGDFSRYTDGSNENGIIYSINGQEEKGFWVWNIGTNDTNDTYEPVYAGNILMLDFPYEGIYDIVVGTFPGGQEDGEYHLEYNNPISFHIDAGQFVFAYLDEVASGEYSLSFSQEEGDSVGYTSVYSFDFEDEETHLGALTDSNNFCLNVTFSGNESYLKFVSDGAEISCMLILGDKKGEQQDNQDDEPLLQGEINFARNMGGELDVSTLEPGTYLLKVAGSALFGRAIGDSINVEIYGEDVPALLSFVLTLEEQFTMKFELPEGALVMYFDAPNSDTEYTEILGIAAIYAYEEAEPEVTYDLNITISFGYSNTGSYLFPEFIRNLNVTVYKGISADDISEENIAKSHHIEEYDMASLDPSNYYKSQFTLSLKVPASEVYVTLSADLPTGGWSMSRTGEALNLVNDNTMYCTIEKAITVTVNLPAGGMPTPYYIQLSVYEGTDESATEGQYIVQAMEGFSVSSADLAAGKKDVRIGINQIGDALQIVAKVELGGLPAGWVLKNNIKVIDLATEEASINATVEMEPKFVFSFTDGEKPESLNLTFTIYRNQSDKTEGKEALKVINLVVDLSAVTSENNQVELALDFAELTTYNFYVCVSGMPDEWNLNYNGNALGDTPVNMNFLSSGGAWLTLSVDKAQA